MARALSCVVLVVLTGCVLRDTPALRACASGVSSLVSGPSSGALRVIPSRVPGMEIDTATWQTYADVEAFQSSDGVVYHVTVHSTTDSLNRDVALLYVLRDASDAQTLLVDTHLDVEPLGEGKSVHNQPTHTKGQQLTSSRPERPPMVPSPARGARSANARLRCA